MNFLPQRCRELITKYQLGDLDTDEFCELESLLKNNFQAREIFRKSCRIDALLRSQSESIEGKVPRLSTFAKFRPILLAAVAIVLISAIAIVIFRNQEVAHLASTDSAVWGKKQYQSGSPLKPGSKVELESGTATVKFKSGAVSILTGPANFQVSSSNSGYLVSGTVQSIADSPKARGFTVNMPTLSVVDVGTEFKTQVSANNNSLVEVVDGEVGAHIGGLHQSLSTGMILSVQGNPPMMIQVQKGAGTPDFKFLSIEPPTNSDFVDKSRGLGSSILIRGRLGLSSNDNANEGNLVDGVGQSHSDQRSKSFYFRNSEVGTIIFDLGTKLPVTKVNTYSWAQRQNSFQSYVLLGYAGEVLPDISDTPAIDGWVKVAEIDSDKFFAVKDTSQRPPQQACSIESASGLIGKYRFLYFDVRSNINKQSHEDFHTMFSEIDIFIKDAH